MRPTFALDLDLRPISVNVPKSHPNALRVGDVLYFASEYDTQQYGIVPADTKVFVMEIDEDTGTTWLLAEGDVPALFNWDNMLALVPYDTEDLLPCLRAAIRCPVAQVAPDAPSEPVQRSKVLPMAKVLAIAAVLLGALAPVQVGHLRGIMAHATHSAVDLEPSAELRIIRT